MRHLDIRDLWLQKEVSEGKVEVSKIAGENSTADLMTKILKVIEITSRLKGMFIEVQWSSQPVWSVFRDHLMQFFHCGGQLR